MADGRKRGKVQCRESQPRKTSFFIIIIPAIDSLQCTAAAEMLTVHSSTASNAPGINCGKVKTRRKNTQLEKYLLAWAAERSAY